MTAPLSPAQAEHLARVEAAEAAPESLRERVAEALAACHLSGKPYKPQPSGPPRNDWTEFADAAIAAVTTPVAVAPAGWSAEAAVRRVLKLCDDVEAVHEHNAREFGIGGPRVVISADEIRAALAAPAAAADTQGGGR